MFLNFIFAFLQIFFTIYNDFENMKKDEKKFNKRRIESGIRQCFTYAEVFLQILSCYFQSVFQ